MCLQEVSAKSLKETFIPNLRHVGLECFGYAPSQTAAPVKGKYGHKYIGNNDDDFDYTIKAMQ